MILGGLNVLLDCCRSFAVRSSPSLKILKKAVLIFLLGGGMVRCMVRARFRFSSIFSNNPPSTTKAYIAPLNIDSEEVWAQVEFFPDTCVGRLSVTQIVCVLSEGYIVDLCAVM